MAMTTEWTNSHPLESMGSRRLPGIGELVVGLPPPPPSQRLHAAHAQAHAHTHHPAALDVVGGRGGVGEGEGGASTGISVSPCLPTAPDLDGDERLLTTNPPTRAQLPSPCLTFNAASSCSTPACGGPTAAEWETTLEALLGQPHLDVVSVVDCVADILDASIWPAYRQGWYRPHSPDNEFHAPLEDEIRGMDRDDLVKRFFDRSDGRVTYGQHITYPNKRKKDDSDDGDDHGGLGGATRLARQPTSAEQHMSTERERRKRHGLLMTKGDLRCCDIAAKCGINRADEDKSRTSRMQWVKGPGKDEQLWTAVFAHEFSARVVQSEHDGRKRAESVVHLLVKHLIRQQRFDPDRAQHGACHKNEPGRPGAAGVKRGRKGPWEDNRGSRYPGAGHEPIDGGRQHRIISDHGSPGKRYRGLSMERLVDNALHL